MKQRMVSLSLVLLLLLGMLPMQVGAVTTKLPADQAAAYAEELQRIIGLYGIGAGDAHMDPGLYYAQLLDLNADGVQELFYIYAPGTDGNRIANFAAYSFQGGQLRRWFDERYLYAVGSRENKSLHLGQGESGAYYLRIAGDSSNGVQSNEYGTILALDGGVQEVASYNMDLYYETMGYDESTPIYLDKELVIDGETVLDTHTRTDAFGELSDIPFSEWEVYRPRYGLDSSTWLADVVMGTLHIEKSDVETLLADLQTAANVGASQQDLLARLTYHGDRSLCKMDAKMAQAYADALAGMPAHYDDGYKQGTLHAALYDIAGDGMPLLLTAYLMDDPSDADNLMWGEDPALAAAFWTYGNGEATRYAFEKDAYASTRSMYIGTWGGETMLAVDEGFLLDVGGYGGTLYYGVKNAQLTLLHSEQCFSVYSIDAATAEGQALPGKKDKSSGSHTILLEELVAGNWDITYSEVSGFFHAYLLLFDGVKLTRHDGGYMPSFFPYEYDKVTRIYNLDAHSFMEAAMARASTLMAALTAYAQSAGKPSYTFPAVTDDEALVRAIAQAVAAKLGGEITGIYQLADGLWYVVITVDGTAKGAVVQAVQSDGKLTYEVLDSHDTPAEEEVLQGLANDFQSTPNLSPDYAATEDFTTTKDFLDYLNGLLGHIPGGTPNDAAKGELAAFLENSVSRVSTVTVTAQGNRVTLTGGNISAGCTSAKDAADKLVGALADADVTLNKTLTIIIRIECQGLDSGKPLQLDLDKSLLDTLGDAELMLLLGDSSRAVRITAANLRMLIDAYETLSIQMEKTGDAYTINFLNAEGKIITRLCANVSFLLPATGPLATVLASYEGGER